MSRIPGLTDSGQRGPMIVHFVRLGLADSRSKYSKVGKVGSLGQSASLGT